MLRKIREFLKRWMRRTAAGLLCLVGTSGIYVLECVNPDGTIAWTERIKNGVTNTGMNNMLDVYFNSGSQSANWYIGLIDNSGYSGVAASDTISSHAGWTENTDYTESNRVAWGNGSASGQAVTNASAAEFSINASITIKGAFVVNQNTKGGTTGTLYSTGVLAGTQALSSGQTLRVTYTNSLAAS